MLLAFFAVSACSKATFTLPLKGSAILKDKKTVYYDVTLYMKSEAGLEEVTHKSEKIKHAVRLVAAQRGSRHMEHPGRLISVMNKIFKSQLKHHVTKVKVNSFEVK